MKKIISFLSFSFFRIFISLAIIGMFTAVAYPGNNHQPQQQTPKHNHTLTSTSTFNPADLLRELINQFEAIHETYLGAEIILKSSNTHLITLQELHDMGYPLAAKTLNSENLPRCSDVMKKSNWKNWPKVTCL